MGTWLLRWVGEGASHFPLIQRARAPRTKWPVSLPLPRKGWQLQTRTPSKGAPPIWSQFPCGSDDEVTVRIMMTSASAHPLLSAAGEPQPRASLTPAPAGLQTALVKVWGLARGCTWAQGTETRGTWLHWAPILPAVPAPRLRASRDLVDRPHQEPGPFPQTQPLL